MSYDFKSLSVTDSSITLSVTMSILTHYGKKSTFVPDSL